VLGLSYAISERYRDSLTGYYPMPLVEGCMLTSAALAKPWAGAPLHAAAQRHVATGQGHQSGTKLSANRKGTKGGMADAGPSPAVPVRFLQTT